MKTKIILLVLFCSTFTYSAFAQHENKNKWGCSISINDANSQMAYYGEGGLSVDANGNMLNAGKKANKSFSISATSKYYVNNDWLIRFEFGLTQINLTNSAKSYSSPANTTNPTTNDIIKQQITRYIPSVQFNFFKNKRIESYVGVSLQYIKYASLNRNLYIEQRDANTDTLVSWNKSIVSIPGGYAMGLGVFAGFNVFLHKHLSLGAEFSSALLYYNVGGEIREQYSYQYKPSPSASITNISNDSYKGTRFTKILSSFNISVWF